MLNLLEGIEAWPDLERRIASLPTEMERGEVFEEFCKPFFILDPVFQFKEVYCHNEIPSSLRQHLGYPGTQDIGIDGLCVTLEDKLFAYQAKFRSDRNNTPTLRELSTFFTVSDRADWRITITNANSLPTAINDRTKQSRILSDRFDQLAPSFFKQLRQYLTNQIVAPQDKKGPHITQTEAIEAALSYFRDNDRGQLILPCGTGKTLASMWIAERLGCNRILIMLPSLFLMSQTLREWAVNSTIRPFRYLCLCSDTTVDLGNDAPIEHLYEMDVPVTTDVKTVSDFLLNTISSTSIVFSTYQSSIVLSEAVKNTKYEFDIAIFDEAHRTTGTNAGVWNLALHDNNVKAKKRMFMTATPRIYAPHVVKKAQDDDIPICSMDDEKIYGKPFYEMTFGDAIKREHITDYKVVVIFVTDAEVSSLIKSKGRVLADGHEWDAKAFAKRIALAKGMNAYGLKKVFTFHGKVSGAKAFTNITTPYGMNKAFELLGENTITRPDIKYFHVNGKMPSGVRKSLMKEFKDARIGIMSNARCLTEGVDVPAVDTVAFVDPKKSIVDIVQATGRAMRRDEWKERGYIFIPVIVEDETNPEEVLESSDFNTVWDVLQAIADQDCRLESVVSTLRVLQGKGEVDSHEWKDAMSDYTERVEFFDIPKRIDRARFLNALYTRTLEVIGKTWDFWFGLTIKYMRENGTPNVTDKYVSSDGYKLRSWQSNQRKQYKTKMLLPERTRRLEEIGFTWDLLEEAFEKGFEETVKYKEQHGTPNAPNIYITDNGYKLGSWQGHQRQLYKKKKILPERILRLEEIGYLWDTYEEGFERGFEETIKYKKQFGNSNVPIRYATSDGFNLGTWQTTQRQQYKKKKLSTERMRRLEEIGFTWNPFDGAFEKGFEETVKYKELHGIPNAPNRYVSSEGFKLGGWQGDQRKQYKQGKLSPERARRFEEIGFCWDTLDEAFEKLFAETVSYKELNGTPNVPQNYITSKGLRLGAWQNQKRVLFKKKKLSPERVRRLEEIGFSWERVEDAFEKGFAETVKYKEQNGTPNAPAAYTTSEGFKLGGWQGHQRRHYKVKKLLPDRMKRLENVGFTWYPLVDAFERGFEETVKYKEKHETPNAPAKHITDDGFRLGKWQCKQREIYKNNKLAPHRISRLINIGLVFDPLREAFERGYEETVKYKEQNGTPNAPDRYVTPTGFKLGLWQRHQKNYFKNKKLSPAKIRRLEKLDFIWDTLNETFKRGIQETLKHKKQCGTPNALISFTTSDGFRLGLWQSRQRAMYRRKKILPERIRRLEEIGFHWQRKREGK